MCIPFHNLATYPNVSDLKAKCTHDNSHYCHMLQVLVNYSGNLSCDEHTYDIPTLYGASVSYSVYSLYDNCTCMEALLVVCLVL